MTFKPSLLVAACMIALCTSTAIGADIATPNAQQLVTPSYPANAISPYALLDQTRTQLAERFPDLSQQDLDQLVFKIADINSLKGVQ